MNKHRFYWGNIIFMGLMTLLLTVCTLVIVVIYMPAYEMIAFSMLRFVLGTLCILWGISAIKYGVLYAQSSGSGLFKIKLTGITARIIGTMLCLFGVVYIAIIFI